MTLKIPRIKNIREPKVPKPKIDNRPIEKMNSVEDNFKYADIKI